MLTQDEWQCPSALEAGAHRSGWGSVGGFLGYRKCCKGSHVRMARYSPVAVTEHGRDEGQGQGDGKG